MIDQEAPTRDGTCPPWCVEAHPADRGDAVVHIGDPVYLSAGISARLCMSVDAAGEVVDGPFVLVGEEEYTLDEAITLGTTLVAMARLDQSPQAPSGAESPKRG